MKHLNLFLSLSALLLAALVAVQFGIVPAALLLTLASCALNTPRARLCAVTLSVPELLSDVLGAFKVETPEIFGPNGFCTDFSSDTAVLGDTVTGKIAHVPATADYDPSPGVGFYSGVQDVTALIEDVPVTLAFLKHVPVRVKWLTQLSSKNVPLYKAAIANLGFALGKLVLDTILTTAISNVSNYLAINPAFMNVDGMEALRTQCNSQRMAGKGRFAIFNSPLAAGLNSDDRVKSKLFYDQRNGAQGFSRWTNLAGFDWIREYTDFPAIGNVTGLVGDRRLATVSVRKIKDVENTAKELGVKQVMQFDSLKDEESGLELTGIGWQERGTGDVIVSVAVLFGLSVGNGGGIAGSQTDNAGCLLKSM